MWRGAIWLLLFQLGGEGLARGAGVPLPGPVLGMAGLFAFLIYRKRMPTGLDPVADFLLRHLSLFFIPATVVALSLVGGLASEGMAILFALVVSTLVGLSVTALVFTAATRGRSLGDAEAQEAE